MKVQTNTQPTPQEAALATALETLLDHIIDDLSPNSRKEKILEVSQSLLQNGIVTHGSGDVPSGHKEEIAWHAHSDWAIDNELDHDHRGRAYWHNHTNEGTVYYQFDVENGPHEVSTVEIELDADTETRIKWSKDCDHCGHSRNFQHVVDVHHNHDACACAWACVNCGECFHPECRDCSCEDGPSWPDHFQEYSLTTSEDVRMEAGLAS